jgi:radical SAM protein with 4Fe4S-binding SPASM domain
MTTLEDKIFELDKQYEIISVFDLNQWFDRPVADREKWLSDTLNGLWREAYEDKQRLIFTLTCGDEYESQGAKIGTALMNLQFWLNRVDISNFFVIILTNEPEIHNICEGLQTISRDPVNVNVHGIGEPLKQKKMVSRSKYSHYQYNSSDLVSMSMDQLTDRERFLLTESKTFCIYPWIHLHASPDGKAYPCCLSEYKAGSIGNCHTQSLEEIWKDEPMQRLRDNMLNERPSAECTRCYELEKSGFFSQRQSSNKHHGHNIKKLDSNPFELAYWDIRFSNLCNLRCRSCGHIFSSQWYQDQVKLAGPEWGKNHKPLMLAGKNETDLVEQLLKHVDYVEQIYFAGGEPLMMEQHYLILDELERRGRFDVKLIYNTNFTQTKLKDRSVFDYWRKFKSVSIGASLDDFGARAEYIRKGTRWSEVEQNRREMMQICPNVDFYVSPTLSILNVWHLPDFHRYMVEQGFIKAQDLHVNNLLDPRHYRIDIAPASYKQQLNDKYRSHIEWLKDKDPLNRATVGFEAALTFMNATENTHLIDQFWEKTRQLDEIRNESVLDVIPELQALS